MNRFNRFIFLRPLANGIAFPNGILDTETQEIIKDENNITQVINILNKLEDEKNKYKQAFDKCMETLNWYANTDNWRYKSTELETKARDTLSEINKILEVSY